MSEGLEVLRLWGFAGFRVYGFRFRVLGSLTRLRQGLQEPWGQFKMKVLESPQWPKWSLILGIRGIIEGSWR